MFNHNILVYHYMFTCLDITYFVHTEDRAHWWLVSEAVAGVAVILAGKAPLTQVTGVAQVCQGDMESNSR